MIQVVVLVSHSGSLMTSGQCCFVWNVRCLNDRARRSVVRQLLQTYGPSLVCLLETKLSAICNALANEILGAPYDYDFLPSAGASGGIVFAWLRDQWTVSDVTKGQFMVSAKLLEVGLPTNAAWWITVVYGPQHDEDKVQFLDDMIQFRQSFQGPWYLCGDFNMIYRASNKNNDRLDRRSMRRFRRFLNQARLQEIELTGRRYTWFNERVTPTLELLDRMFATAEWFAALPNHVLKPLSTDCSDHCPLLLQFEAITRSKRRFRFEPFWAKLTGYMETVIAASEPTPTHVDPLRMLDYKFRRMARALWSWSNSKIGSVNLQLTLAREVILRFDEEQERRLLEPWEADLRRCLKVRTLGLASLCKTIVRQRWRMLFPAEGDANTRFYQLQACHRSQQNTIHSLWVNGTKVISDQGLSSALFQYYNDVLGSNF